LTPKPQPHLPNLEVFRGLAALAVCLYHFNREGFLGEPVSAIVSYGYLGVDVFFVISGFVIFLSLSRHPASFPSLRRFLVGRVFRLYPAYLAASLGAILLWHLSTHIPGFQGDAPDYTLRQVWANLTMTCNWIQVPWFIVVAWTLAIEAQYYLLAAASFGLLTHSALWIRLGTLALWIATPLVAGNSPTVFAWSALFALGILSWMKREKSISPLPFWILFTIASLVHTEAKGLASGIVGTSAALAILYLPEIRVRPLLWLGTISYSLYLVHTFIGGLVINLATRLPDRPILQVGAVFLALAVSLIAALGLYLLVEKPSHNLARRLRSKP